MAFALSSPPTITTVLFIALSIVAFAVRRRQVSQAQPSANKLSEPNADRPVSEAARRLIEDLSSALPDNTILPTDVEAFEKSINTHWAKQECEVVPSCIIRPRTTAQLSTAITILKREYDERKKNNLDGGNADAAGLFAIRSGGHSPVARSASIEDGVLIDMSHLSDMTSSEDGSSVTIGAGARWGKVYEVLEAKHLTVAGGRNSAVGVGGLVLGGNYEIVLASGSIATASATTNPDLWRALKGGGNNFGVVTRFTARSFPSDSIWSGFLYMPSGQSAKVLFAFHDFVNRANPNEPSAGYDNHASGPIACFTYLQQLGVQAIAVNLVYTKAPENARKWPACWEKSSFKPLWRLWSTCKERSLSNACDEMNALNPPGRRQTFATTTIKNDPATIQATHDAYKNAIAPIKLARIEGMSWTLVLQPILPDWMHKGDANPLGLRDTVDGPLVLVSFTVNWAKRQDDGLVEKLTREAIEQIDAFAAANGTAHRYRYMNYCGSWQKPFQGYGEDNLKFLQDTSEKYDPDGLFQHACVGGFKLGMADGKGIRHCRERGKEDGTG
ncbi:hypothetical protein N0V90_012864 [Kalmusia sp. IMI 367209]|nr:hypothetical protein N0V90_012864 [Kalmusia sp. IMI 367209]